MQRLTVQARIAGQDEDAVRLEVEEECPSALQREGFTGMHAILHALSITGSMAWEITWALILGFALSAVVQAVVPKAAVVDLLGDDRPRTLAVASCLGAASSSCSYAAVALARSLFVKGADFTAAMAFEIASTNLVVELGVILALLMGWQFTAAEFVGGPIIIVLIALAFRLVVRKKLLEEAREQADKGLAGSMEGHAAMDMSVQGEGSFARRLFSGDGDPNEYLLESYEYYVNKWVNQVPVLRKAAQTVDDAGQLQSERRPQAPNGAEAPITRYAAFEAGPLPRSPRQSRVIATRK